MDPFKAHLGALLSIYELVPFPGTPIPRSEGPTVQDVARVCNAVARGDLSQKITVVVQGVVMVQLKDVINTMVCISFIFLSSFPFLNAKIFQGGQIGTIRKGGYSCISRSRN